MILDNLLRFDRDNPHVYEQFEAAALQLIERGQRRFSVSMIIDQMRFMSRIETKGEPYKLNDHYTAYYARKFRVLHPDHADRLRFRTLTAGATEAEVEAALRVAA